MRTDARACRVAPPVARPANEHAHSINTSTARSAWLLSPMKPARRHGPPTSDSHRHTRRQSAAKWTSCGGSATSTQRPSSQGGRRRHRHRCHRRRHRRRRPRWRRCSRQPRPRRECLPRTYDTTKLKAVSRYPSPPITQRRPHNRPCRHHRRPPPCPTVPVRGVVAAHAGWLASHNQPPRAQSGPQTIVQLQLPPRHWPAGGASGGAFPAPPPSSAT